MKATKLILPVLLVLIAALWLCPPKAQAATADDLTFALNNDGQSYYVGRCDRDASGVLEIPATYEGKPVTVIGDSAFYNCAFLTNVIIPDSVTIICIDAFWGCTGLTTVTIGNGVTVIGDCAFRGCSSLTSVILPEGVTSIYAALFSGCTNLTSVIIPDSVSEIYASAFGGCTALRSVTLGSNVRYIDDASFAGCQKLTSIVIPTRVGWIGIHAFNGCDALREVYYTGTSEQWNDIRFYDGNAALTNSTIHFGYMELLAHPESTVKEPGQNAQFKVAVYGSGLTYSWQYSEDGGETWLPLEEASSALTVAATAERNGNLYRCVITNDSGNSITSETATLTVIGQEFSWKTQPADVSAKLGKTAVFAVEVSGDVAAYQWQYRITANGPWWNCTAATAGYNTATVRVTSAQKRDGFLYRCRITDALGNKYYSDAAMLTCVPAPVFTLHPQSVTAQAGSSILLTAEPSGDYARVYWQYSCNAGRTWYASSFVGKDTTALTVPVTAARNGFLYRCVVIDADGNRIESAPAKLTVE